MKKVLGGMAAIAVAGMFGANSAHAIDFDPTGTGTFGGLTLNQLDWKAGNSLAVGGQTAVNNFILNQGDGGTRDVSFDLLYQASLSIFEYTNGDFGTIPSVGAQAKELTVVVGIREKVVNAASSPATGDPFAEFSFINDDLHGSGTPDFFEVYYGDKNASDLAGTGFNDGTLILSADIQSVATNTFAVTNPAAVNLDQTADGNQYGTQKTVTGHGETSGKALVGYFNPLFFNDTGNGSTILDFTLLNNVGLATPFTAVNPSAAFVTDAGGVSPTTMGAAINGTGTLGSTNGVLFGNGTDFQFQTDSNQSFVQVVVPEPMTASLGLLGLGGLLLGTRRRRSI